MQGRSSWKQSPCHQGMDMYRSLCSALLFIRNYGCCRNFGVSQGKIKWKDKESPAYKPACPDVPAWCPPVCSRKERGPNPTFSTTWGSFCSGILVLQAGRRQWGLKHGACLLPSSLPGCFFPAIKSAKRNVGPGAEWGWLERLPKWTTQFFSLNFVPS